MSLIHRSGSSTTPSTQPGDPTPQTTPDLLAQAPYVKNPAVEQTAFDQEAYLGDTQALQGYAEGIRKTVTFFSNIVGAEDRRTSVIDTSTRRHNATTRYTQVNNFEITLVGGFNFQYDASKNEAAITGEILIYPNFPAKRADLFVADLGDGVTGIFRLGGVSPLGWRYGRMLRATFQLWKYAEEEDIQQLMDCAVKTMWFDKEVYLTDLSTMLEADAFRQLTIIRQMRTVLGQYFHRTFYDRALKSYFPPSGVYDPYLVKFVTPKIPFAVVAERPRQLWPRVDETFDFTVWGRLSDPLNLTLIGLWRWTTLEVATHHYYDVAITPLLNRRYRRAIPPSGDLVDGEVTQDNYGLSAAFYDGTGTPDALDNLVAGLITTGKVSDVAGFIADQLTPFSALPLERQFYAIPVYLHAIDVIEATFAAGR